MLTSNDQNNIQSQSNLDNEMSFSIFFNICGEQQAEISKKFLQEKQKNRKYSFSYFWEQESSDEEVKESITSIKQDNVLDSKNFQQLDKQSKYGQSNNNIDKQKFSVKNLNAKNFQQNNQKNLIGTNQDQSKKANIKKSGKNVKFLQNIDKEDFNVNNNHTIYQQQQSNNQQKDGLWSKEDALYYFKENSNNPQVENKLLNSQNQQQIKCKKEKFSNFDDFQFQPKSLFDVDTSKIQEAQKIFDNFEQKEETDFNNYQPKSLFDIDSSKIQEAQKILDKFEQKEEPDFNNFQPRSLFDVDSSKIQEAQKIFDNFEQKDETDFSKFQPRSLFDIDKEKQKEAKILLNNMKVETNDNVLQIDQKKQNYSQEQNDFCYQPRSLFDIDKDKMKKAQDILNGYDNDQIEDEKQNSVERQKQLDEQFEGFQFKPTSLFDIKTDNLEQAKKILDSTQKVESKNIPNMEKQIQLSQYSQIKIDKSQKSSQQKRDNCIQLQKKQPNQNLKKSQKKVKKFRNSSQQIRDSITEIIQKNQNQKFLQFQETNTEYDFSYLNNTHYIYQKISMNGSTIGLFMEKLNLGFDRQQNFDYDWVANHIRQLRYKCFYKNIHDKREIFKRVYQELEYRYWREKSQKFCSSVKQIVNSEDPIEKQIVLMVQQIKIKNNYVQIELTDGWYSLYIKIQKNSSKKINFLLNLVKKGLIYPTKTLLIQNYKINNKKQQKNLYNRNYITIDLNNFFPIYNEPLGFKFSNSKPIKFNNIYRINSIICLIDAVIVQKTLNFVKFNDQEDYIQLTNDDDIQEYLYNNQKLQECIPNFFFSIDIVQYPQDSGSKVFTVNFNNVNFQYYDYLELYQRYQFKDLKQIVKDTQNVIFSGNGVSQNFYHFNFQKKSRVQNMQLSTELKKSFKSRYKSHNINNTILQQIKSQELRHIFIKRMECYLIYLKQLGKNCVFLLFFIEPNNYFYFMINRFRYQFICQKANVGKQFQLSEVSIKNTKYQKIDGKYMYLIKMYQNKFTGMKIISQQKQKFIEMYKKIKNQIEYIVQKTT